MVHVWSINSGERFQGHHGPLVLYTGKFINLLAYEGLTPYSIMLTLMTLGKKSIVGKAENAGNQNFLLIPICLLPYERQISFLSNFNPFPNKPWFLHVCSTSLLKTLCKMEKLHLTSNFSFSHSVFYTF